jgi:hypothetical protein
MVLVGTLVTPAAPNTAKLARLEPSTGAAQACEGAKANAAHIAVETAAWTAQFIDFIGSLENIFRRIELCLASLGGLPPS